MYWVKDLLIIDFLYEIHNYNLILIVSAKTELNVLKSLNKLSRFFLDKNIILIVLLNNKI